MRLFVIIALLLLSSAAQGETPQKCLTEGELGELVGTVARGSFFHPVRGRSVEGYKIILLQRQCFNYESNNSGQKGQIDVVEVQLWWADGIERQIGKTVKVIGRMDNYAINVIAWPQIYVYSYKTCAGNC